MGKWQHCRDINSFAQQVNKSLGICNFLQFLFPCICLQVQTELRRWLWKCHNQSHLTPAKRSITQITIRTHGGLGLPASSGNISSV